MGYFFRVMRSNEHLRPAGTVDIPFLGAKVGEFVNWTLTRRGDTGPDAGLYDLRAVFSFVTEPLWEDAEYNKRIVLAITPNKKYLVKQSEDENFKTVLQNRNLLIEGVTIHEFN